jgi:CubicO group peptidase (beta-lactamase class C family)
MRGSTWCPGSICTDWSVLTARANRTRSDGVVHRPTAPEALPGLAWSYSGGGYLIVAQAICDITGLAFDEAMAELVLGPTDMGASTFRQPLPASLERENAHR